MNYARRNEGLIEARMKKKLVIRLRGANATSLHQKVDNKYKEIGIQAKLSPGSREQTPIQQSYAILSEMQENISKTPKGRRWSHYFRKFTIGLFLISPAALIYLSQYLPLMSRSSVYRGLNEILSKKPKLCDIDSVPERLQQYVEELNKDNSIRTPGILAVDAVSLTPNVVITEEADVKGMITTI